MNRLKDIIQKRSIIGMIRKTNEATDLEEIKKYEDTIIASILSALCFFGAMLNFGIRMFWRDHVLEIILTTIILFIVSIIIDYVNFHVRNENLRIHLISFITVLLEVFVVIAYFERLGTMVWTVVFLFLMISIIRLDRIMFAFISLSAIILNNYMFFTKLNYEIVLDIKYYVIQINLFLMIFIMGMIWSKLYHQRLQKSYELFVDTTKKKEEITGLYEEIVASEEELREQNERLYNYNQEIKEGEKRLNYMAYNDILTGLPNRKQLIERLNFLIELSEESKNKMALVFIDLDDFKNINDSRGHHYGDEFLKSFGKRLSNYIDEKDTACRFGGDEFAVIIQHYQSEEELLEYIDGMKENLSDEMVIEGESFPSKASYGVAIYPDDAKRVVDLFKAADVAMYKAKEMGRNNIQFYRQEMKEEIIDKIEMEHELSKALEKNELRLVFQPQVAVSDKRDHGFEALLRWESEKRGLIYPDRFIPLLESTGLIIDIGYWVIREACLKVNELNGQYDEKFYISVNISTKQLRDKHFVTKVATILQETGTQGQHIEFEITETVLIEDTDDIIAKLMMLKAMDIKVALDDFGTGYASLNYLKVLPIDVLKIDKTFIWDMDKDEASKKLVKSIIDIVHDLNLVVVAEGVETTEQLNYLVEKSCDQIQGYLISKPLESHDLHDFIENR